MGLATSGPVGDSAALSTTDVGSSLPVSRAVASVAAEVTWSGEEVEVFFALGSPSAGVDRGGREGGC